MRSGITIASLKTEGKTPVCRDLLIMAVTAGSSWSKHPTKRDVGIGSSEQIKNVKDYVRKIIVCEESAIIYFF